MNHLNCGIFIIRECTDIELDVVTAKIKCIIVLMQWVLYLLSTVGASSSLLLPVAISASVEPPVNKGEREIYMVR